MSLTDLFSAHHSHSNHGHKSKFRCQSAGRRALRHSSRVRRFEALEDRNLLAVTVGTEADVVNGDVTSIAALVAHAGDDGISLREAIIAANNTPGADVINFDTNVFGRPQQITLGHGQLKISDDLTIYGPGADQLTVSGNKASRVFYVDSGTEVTMKDLTISEGAAQEGSSERDGGGIWNQGTLTIDASTISGNSVISRGGGIFNEIGGRLKIHTSTISGNSAEAGGGINSQGTLTIGTSTTSGNSARYAGGILNGGNGGRLKIHASTISGNFAYDWGGGILNGGTMTIDNTIVANSPGGGDLLNAGVGVLTTTGVNIVEDGSVRGENVINEDPLLGPLANNGGPTQTHALTAGSPAINAGDSAFAVDKFDQRGDGFPRIVGGTVDIGAFELQDDTPPNTMIVSATDGEGVIIVDGGLTMSEAMTFVFSGSDDLSAAVNLSFEYRIDSVDDGGWTAATSPLVLDTLSEGSHTFEVRAIYEAGNADPSSATFLWTVLTPVQAIEQLAQAVMDLGLADTNGGKGVENGMLKELSGAVSILTDSNSENDDAAIGKLNEFIDKVEDQRGVRLTDAQADDLVVKANEIIDDIAQGLALESLFEDPLALLVASAL